MRSRRLLSRIAAVCLLCCASGCSKGVQQAPPPVVVTVTGKVTYKGKPVPGALVTLRDQVPDHAAFGITDAQGRFKLGTNDTEGIYPGTYQVTVTSATGRPDLPKKYGSVDTSNLEFVAKAGEPQEFPIELLD